RRRGETLLDLLVERGDAAREIADLVRRPVHAPSRQLEVDDLAAALRAAPSRLDGEERLGEREASGDAAAVERRAELLLDLLEPALFRDQTPRLARPDLRAGLARADGLLDVEEDGRRAPRVVGRRQAGRARDSLAERVELALERPPARDGGVASRLALDEAPP